MLYVGRNTGKRVLQFIFMTILTMIVYRNPLRLPIHDLDSYFFAGILIAWMLSVERRIIRRSTRRLLLAGSAALLLLFILRICRWVVFSEYPSMRFFIASTYYFPFVLVPLFTFYTALSISRDLDTGLPRPTLWLSGAGVLLSILVLTNPLHRLLLRTGNTGGLQDYGWLYLVIVVWTVVLSVGSFGILIRHCRITGSRRLWYIPVLASAAGTALLLWYFFSRGNPMFFGVKLYNLQEAYSFLYISMWECCILIGLIPANTDYREIFQRSPWNALVGDESGQVLYRSLGAAEPDRALLAAALETPQPIDADHVLHAHPIRGGATWWIEDLSAIHEANEQLREAIEYLEEENDLLEEENRIRADHAAFEAQNKLYDSIAPVVQPQLTQARRLMTEATGDEADFRRRLLHGMLLCVYAKRRVNLALIADGGTPLTVQELALSMRETAEYLVLGGVPAAVELSGDAPLPAEQILLVYDFFEEVLERAMPDLGAFLVNIRAGGGLSLRVTMETPTELIRPDWRYRQLQHLGGSLELTREEDSVFARLSFGKDGDPA